jgi:hypothetical protein
MKYMLLIYDDPQVWAGFSPDEQAALYPEYAAVSSLPNTQHAAQLQPAATAKSVRVKNGATVVTDGPFAETKEVLGGYYLIDAGSFDEAVEIAARIPSARVDGTVEIRPLVEA